MNNLDNGSWKRMPFILHCVHQCRKTVHMAGHKKIKATVTSWHRGCCHITQTFGIRQITSFYNRITQRNQMKVPDRPNIDENVNAQTNHVSTTMSRNETNLCKRSFITSVILDHYWTCSDKLSLPFPSFGPFYHQLCDTNPACDLHS